MHSHFHVNLFACPPQAMAASSAELRGALTPTLGSERGGPLTFDAFLPVTFEEAIDALAALPRLDAEPDGFFVISGQQGGERWRISGHLFDFGGRLHRVELHGSCPAGTLDTILACFGWSAARLAFELVREGVTLDEPSFRAWASRTPSDESPEPGR